MVTQKGLGSLHDSGLHMVTQCRGARYLAFGIFELGLCGAENFGGGRGGRELDDFLHWFGGEGD